MAQRRTISATRGAPRRPALNDTPIQPPSDTPAPATPETPTPEPGATLILAPSATSTPTRRDPPAPEPDDKPEPEPDDPPAPERSDISIPPPGNNPGPAVGQGCGETRFLLMFISDIHAAEPPALPLEPGGKNAESDAKMVSAASDALMPLTAGAPFVTCDASRNENWTTTGSSFAVVRQCSFSAPQNGWVHIVANGSPGRWNGEYEAQFRLGIASTTGEGDTDRWVNVYDDSGDGTDETLALSVLRPLKAGTYTFSLPGQRYSGSGTMRVFDPTLVVITTGARHYLPVVAGCSS